MINPELTPFLTIWAEKWARVPQGASPADRRAAFEVIAQEMRLPTPDGVSTDEIHWIDSPSGPVRLRVFRPQDGGNGAALIYLHGGAWMQGSPETHWDITARLAAWTGAAVFSVDYAKAPERPFPAAFDQVRAAALWLAATGQGVDPARIAIGGDSAGGNLAAAVALDLRGTLQFAAQLLIYPACDFDQGRPSYAENPDGPIIAVKGMDFVNRSYSPDEALLSRDPRLAPLLAASHAGLPPTWLAVAQHDPLRDSGVAYAEALRAAGVPVVLDRGEGLIHGYLRAMDYCAASRESLATMAGWLRGVLAPVIRPQSPGLDFVFSIQADIAPPRNAGPGPLGQRLHIPILGGQVTGPRLTGRILPGGSDWPILGPDGNSRIMAHYTIEASDGALIYVQNEGLRVSSAMALDQIRAGHDPGAQAFYMRAAPRFDCADGPHQWLRLSLFVCSLAPGPASIAIDVYRVT